MGPAVVGVAPRFPVAPVTSPPGESTSGGSRPWRLDRQGRPTLVAAEAERTRPSMPPQVRPTGFGTRSCRSAFRHLTIRREPCRAAPRLRATWDSAREVRSFSSTGLLPSVAAPSHALRLTPYFVTPRPLGRTVRTVPRPRVRNACRLSRVLGLASSAFARQHL
jgi:hypothetical protein